MTNALATQRLLATKNLDFENMTDGYDNKNN